MITGLVTPGGFSCCFGALPKSQVPVKTKPPNKRELRNQTEDVVNEFSKSSAITFLENEKNELRFLQGVSRHRVGDPLGVLAEIECPTASRRISLRIPGYTSEFPIKGSMIAPWKNFNPLASGVWLSQKDNLTPWHHDWWHGFLIQLRGVKRVRLVPPNSVKALQKSWTLEQRLEKELPPIDTNLNIEGLESTLLLPGDSLYIPPFWWHEVQSMDDNNVSVVARFDAQSDDMPDIFKLVQKKSMRKLFKRKLSKRDRTKLLDKGRRKFAKLLSVYHTPSSSSQQF